MIKKRSSGLETLAAMVATRLERGGDAITGRGGKEELQRPCFPMPIPIPISHFPNCPPEPLFATRELVCFGASVHTLPRRAYLDGSSEYAYAAAYTHTPYIMSDSASTSA